jgi:hypothetical protein
MIHVSIEPANGIAEDPFGGIPPTTPDEGFERDKKS